MKNLKKMLIILFSLLAMMGFIGFWEINDKTIAMTYGIIWMIGLGGITFVLTPFDNKKQKTQESST